MKKRWYIYILVGVIFGIFDFYYQEITSGTYNTFIVWFLVAWGVWLIPAVPVVLYEAKTTKSKLKAALANVLLWSISVISYYLYLMIKLVFIGQATLPMFHISNYKEQYYWSNLKNLLLGQISEGIAEWIVVAIACGAVTGFLLSFIYLHISSKGSKK